MRCRPARTRNPSFGLTFLGSALLTSTLAAQSADDIVAANGDRLLPSNPVNTSGNSEYGSAVALDGTVLVVGAPREETSGTPDLVDTGAVYVYERRGFDWVQTQKLRAPTETQYERFGTSVGVALGTEGEDYLVVGAPTNGGAPGVAYVFRRENGGSWTYDATLANEDPDNGDRCGTGVAVDYFYPVNTLSMDFVFVVVVGCPQDRRPTMSTGSQEGSASIYQRGNTVGLWNRTHSFYGSNGDLLGSSVSVSQEWIVVGVEGLDDAGANAGGARTFRQQNQQPGGEYEYSETRALLPSDPQVASGLGKAVAMSYDPPLNTATAALGAPNYDENTVDEGRVYVYDIDSGGVGVSQTEVAILNPASLDGNALFGTSVAISGQILAAGAPNQGADGAVFLYQQGTDNTEWTPAGQLLPFSVPATRSCDGGETVALDARKATAVLGCPPGNEDAKAAYVFYGAGLFLDDFESGLGQWTRVVP